MAYLISLALGAKEHEQGSGEVNRGERHCGIDRIDEPTKGTEGIPGNADHSGDCEAAMHGAARGAEAINEERDEGPDREDVEQLRWRCEIGSLQEGAVEDLLHRLGVQLDPRHRGLKRRRATIEQTCCTCADQENAAFNLVLTDLTIQHLIGG